MVAKGAKGGNSNSSEYTNGNGGLGGTVRATLKVPPGQVLTLMVGGQGVAGEDANTGGGYNGGGNSSDGSPHGGGGGASDIRMGGSALSNRVMVAGGGGGSTFSIGEITFNGGGGGGLTALEGKGLSRGQGGTQEEGGVGGNNMGTDKGILGAGGTGGRGGGGGGGYYGGGGGGGGGGIGGGGGGSSYTDPTLCTNVVHTQGDNDGDGEITLSWTPPPPFAFQVISPAINQALVLSASNCPVTFTGQGWGKGFVVTGSNGYVFSNVFRGFIQGGAITATGINQPGTYTITVYGDPGQTPVSYPFQVTGTGCK